MMNPEHGLIEAAAFIKRNWRGARHWSRGVIVPWLGWFSRRGYVAVTRDERGRLSGIGMARPARDAEAARLDFYHHDGEGRGIFVDLLIAKSPATMLSLWRMLIRRFGMRQWVALQRWKYNGRLIVHDMTKYDLKMEGLTYGKL